jgi:hypothetical protein
MLPKLVFGNALEEVCALTGGLWSEGSGKGVALVGAVLFEIGNCDLHEWRL